MPAALDGLTVVDFSRVLAGPFATMVLGDLGADVIKVERPGEGDETRAWGPPHDERGQATYFQAVNRNKRSVVLDLADGGDRDRAWELIDRADVLVENFRPGLMERFGLGYEAVSARRPQLVYCSITGFGAGAGAGLAGYDLLVQAMGGLMSITGQPGGPPQKVGVALVDVIAGLFATVAILAAVEERRRSGRGQRIEISLLGALLAALVNQGAAFTIAGHVPERLGNAHPSIVPYDLYQAADGPVVLAVGNDRQFAALCDVLGAPELARESRFATNGARVEHRAELRDRLERLLGREPAGVWAERLAAAGVPAGQVNDIPAAFALAHRLGLDPIVPLPRPDGAEVRLTRNPIAFSRTPPRYDQAPPDLPG